MSVVNPPELLRRPAPKQPAREIEDRPGDYNVWYHRAPGQRDRDKERAKAGTRCIIAKHSGYTRAAENDYFCVFFARGCCTLGASCRYHHRLPTKEDQDRLDTAVDIFGRDKHDLNRDDFGGTGSFSENTTTLFVGRLPAVSSDEEMKQLLRKHFGEWGHLFSVKAWADRGFGFIKYSLRCSAEFAKEAMENQDLGGEEVLNVRWATDDPNPGVVIANAARNFSEIRQKLVDQGISLEDAPFAYPADYQMPSLGNQQPLPSPALMGGAHPGNGQPVPAYPSQLPNYRPAPGGDFGGGPGHFGFGGQNSTAAAEGPAAPPIKKPRVTSSNAVCDAYPDTDAQYAISLDNSSYRVGGAPVSTAVITQAPAPQQIGGSGGGRGGGRGRGGAPRGRGAGRGGGQARPAQQTQQQEQPAAPASAALSALMGYGDEEEDSD